MHAFKQKLDLMHKKAQVNHPRITDKIGVHCLGKATAHFYQEAHIYFSFKKMKITLRKRKVI